MIADIDETRLTLGELLGADEALRGTGEEIAKAVLERTGGEGADAVFDAVGRAKTVAESIDSVRKGGTVTLIGNIVPEVRLPLQKVVSRQIRIQGTAASAGEYPQAIELISSGRIQVRPLITAVAPLEEGPSWFERLHAQEPNLMKIVLVPDGGSALKIARSEAALMTDSLFDLTGQVAIVTGTSRGLGQYFARALAKAGADLVLTSRNRDSLHEFETELRVLGGDVSPLELDVREPRQYRAHGERSDCGVRSDSYPGE